MPEAARSPSTTTIVLADDHAVIRSGLRLLLDSHNGLEVLAEAGDAETALRKVLGHKPDVLVLDLTMPGRPSLEIIPEVGRVSPETRVVILTMEEDGEYVREALQAGAACYVLKESADVELVDAITRATEGGTYLTPRLGAALATAAARDSAPPDGLTERELAVLQALALGHTNAEIAQQLYLSVRTVETYRASIQQKLRCTTRAELTRYVLDHGLMPA